MAERLIHLYQQDLDQQTTTEARQKVRRYWYRAVGLTIMERWSVTPTVLPKRGTHGTRVERWSSYWSNVPDTELEELFYYLKPYFQLEEHKGSDLNT